MDVEVTQSDAKSIEVKADDNIIDLITTDIVDGTLKIALEKSVKNTKSKSVFVTLPNIESLRTSSGASLKSKNTLIVSSLETKASSGSEIKLTVEAEKITCDSSSGSDIEVKGKALKLEAESSSGSDIEADELQTNDVVAKSSSGSSIDVYPILSLDAKATSGSDIKYHNTPKTVSKVTSSGGSVRSN
ncbi:head GIN domain-containing protein [Flavobacterium piscinae]|uniref:head GIN domain-containing protein n=1 Tax=Flavobacterium piscinae TaxID=2506424 RepID=UPI002AABADB1|nr:head GIN domain-containing protein [Flavobacterium piscinae]